MAVYEAYLPPKTICREKARMLAGDRMIMRAFQRLTGVSLIVAAFSLWLMPGSNWAPDLMLFKLVLTAAGVLGGIGLVLASSRVSAPLVELDTRNREVRLVRQEPGQVPVVLQRCAFADLGQVERRGPHMRLWDAEDKFLAEVTLEDSAALGPVLAGLRDAGKLA